MPSAVPPRALPPPKSPQSQSSPSAKRPPAQRPYRRRSRAVRFDLAPWHGGHLLNPDARQPELFALDAVSGVGAPRPHEAMASSPTLFHTLLRPSVLQLLRAQGYHATRTSVADALTDLAGRYLAALCERTARHAAHHQGDAGESTAAAPSLVAVRMALEDMGALLPEAVFEEQEWLGEEDEGAVADFVKWFVGPRSREIKRIALDGEEENTDYLTALKKRHSKTGEDTKYNGTVLGKGNDHGEILVEGGECTSILMWQEKRKRTQAKQREPSPTIPPMSPDDDSRPPSSALSSLGDGTFGDEMDLS